MAISKVLYTFQIQKVGGEKLEGLSGKLKTSLDKEMEGHLEAVERKHMGVEDMAAVLADVPGYKALLNRRAALALMELRVDKTGENGLRVKLSPAAAVESFAGEDGEEFVGLCLERHLKGLLSVSVECEELGGSGEERRRRRENGEEGGGGILRKMGTLLMVLPVLMAGIILFLVYTWITDLQKDYDDLKNTVTVHKDQIINAVEEGVKKSVDVMEVYDAVKSSDLWDQFNGGGEEKADSLETDGAN